MKIHPECKSEFREIFTRLTTAYPLLSREEVVARTYELQRAIAYADFQFLKERYNIGKEK